MVPRRIHQFWDRPAPPDEVVERMRTWPAHHPQWRYTVWNDISANVFIEDTFGVEAATCFRACTIAAMRADLFRIAAMVAIGGLYADADIARNGSAAALSATSCTLYYSIGRESGRVKLRNSFIVASPGHILFAKALDQALFNIRHKPLENNISRMTGPILLTGIWHKHLSNDERTSVRLLTGAEVREYFGRAGRMNYHRSEGHWTEQSKLGPLVDFNRASGG